MKISFIGPLVALLASAILASAIVARAEPLPEISADADAATASLSGVKCVLRAQNGQTQFRRGETIHLIASFTSENPGYKADIFVPNIRGWGSLGALEITPKEGVSDPLGEVPLPDFIFISGYVPEPVTLGKKPVDIPFVLNNWARFDKTGVYQITLTTTRVFASRANQKSSGFIVPSPLAPKIVSAPLQIEIVPADEAWADEQIEITRAYWQTLPKSVFYSETKPPQNDISFLNTRAAMTAIIEHLGQNTMPRSSGDDSYRFRTGLLGFPDRAWLINEMQRSAKRPDYAVTQGFLGLLSELQSVQATPRPAGADATGVKHDQNAQGQWIPRQPTPAQQLQIDWEKRRANARAAAQKRDWLQIAAVTAAKAGAPRALTLHTLLETVWQTNLQKEPQIKAQLPQLKAQLAPVFDLLPPLPRRYMLSDEWDRIKSPALVPALERARQLPVVANDYDAREANDWALRRLAEIAPQMGRAQIIAQIKNPNSRVDFATLSSLPDQTLPALDNVLATNFINERNENLTLSARLVERYASAAALPRIKASYDSSDRFDNQSLPAILAYFVRVNPGYGVPKLAARLRSYRSAQYVNLLFEVASLQSSFSPQLEQLATANLSNAGEGVAVDAAKTLARFGSPAAQNALMKRLRSNGDAAYPKVRARIEPQLVEALANAQNWLCPPAQLRQIRALCQTDAGRQIADEYLRARADREPLVVNYSNGAEQHWDVDRYSGRGLENLRAKLAQFPRGTEFFWQQTSYGPDADQAFAATKQWAAQRGLKIESFDKIGARRQQLSLTS